MVTALVAKDIKDWRTICVMVGQMYKNFILASIQTMMLFRDSFQVNSKTYKILLSTPSISTTMYLLGCHICLYIQKSQKNEEWLQAELDALIVAGRTSNADVHQWIIVRPTGLLFFIRLFSFLTTLVYNSTKYYITQFSMVIY